MATPGAYQKINGIPTDEDLPSSSALGPFLRREDVEEMIERHFNSVGQDGGISKEDFDRIWKKHFG